MNYNKIIPRTKISNFQIESKRIQDQCYYKYYRKTINRTIKKINFFHTVKRFQ